MQRQNVVWLAFMGWVISEDNEWEDYSKYFGEGVETSRNWAIISFSAFDGQPWNFQGACGCVLLLKSYSERIMKLKV